MEDLETRMDAAKGLKVVSEIKAFIGGPEQV